MKLVMFVKAKRAAIGAKSPDGTRVKVAEGKWVPVKKESTGRAKLRVLIDRYTAAERKSDAQTYDTGEHTRGGNSAQTAAATRAFRKLQSAYQEAYPEDTLFEGLHQMLRDYDANMEKAKRAAIGATSQDGKRKKVAEGKWVPIKSGKGIPKRISDKVPAIPPAWTNVQYFDNPDSKLLVKGEDAKGRIQYVYNPDHVTAASKEKFARINALNAQFDSIVAENESNAKSGNESAQCLLLIMETGIRPGSEKQTGAEKDAFGATTLQGKHVKVGKAGVRLEFTGKKGVEQSVQIDSPDTARMLKSRKRKAGSDGRIFNITGDQLLKYTKSLGGNAGFQSKDFRTHLGTEIAMQEISKRSVANESEYKQAVREVADAVADKLGNTRKVALSSYINPVVFEEWRREIE